MGHVKFSTFKFKKTTFEPLFVVWLAQLCPVSKYNFCSFQVPHVYILYSSVILGYDHVVLLLVLLVPPRLGHLAPASDVAGGLTTPF
jgi:hypothetical protein